MLAVGITGVPGLPVTAALGMAIGGLWLAFGRSAITQPDALFVATAKPSRRATVRGGRWAPSGGAVTTLTLTAKAAWSGRSSRTCAPRWAAWSPCR